MLAAAFDHVRDWVFDLDNTLYPPEMRLFDQIEARMTAYVVGALGITEQEADHLRRSYWVQYGTTLAGLMEEHGLDPDPFLEDVHDISFDDLSPDPELRIRIKNLPGRRFVYTNGTRDYAEQVLAARGLNGLFEAIFGVEHAGYRPKPERKAFDAVFAIAGIRPSKGAFFEDEPRNLQVPNKLGMRTVLVTNDTIEAEHIDFHTHDLSGFLAQLAC